jgi:hypothetical protein
MNKEITKPEETVLTNYDALRDVLQAADEKRYYKTYTSFSAIEESELFLSSILSADKFSVAEIKKAHEKLDKTNPASVGAKSSLAILTVHLEMLQLKREKDSKKMLVLALAILEMISKEGNKKVTVKKSELITHDMEAELKKYTKLSDLFISEFDIFIRTIEVLKDAYPDEYRKYTMAKPLTEKLN